MAYARKVNPNPLTSKKHRPMQHPMLTMHVVLEEKPEDPTALVRSVKQVPKSKFGINHSTIEVELGDCADH